MSFWNSDLNLLRSKLEEEQLVLSMEKEAQEEREEVSCLMEGKESYGMGGAAPIMQSTNDDFFKSFNNPEFLETNKKY